jgi:REP element-mobilizing transposase RayT
MAKDVYHEMFLHVTWHTKESRRIIVPQMEVELHDIIRRRALQPGGVFVHGVGGTEWHIHLVARIHPSLNVPEWIGRIKGGSSHDINATERWRKSMDWQSGYGLVTFGMKELPWVIDYVKNQKEHHRNGTTFDRLERFEGEEEDGSSQESKPPEGPVAQRGAPRHD